MAVWFTFIFFYGGILAACYGDDYQECGIRYAVNRHQPAISYGYLTKRSEYPWHVAIYKEHNATKNPEYICGGSIIDHHLIISAAHCVYDEINNRIDNATFIVVAGKHYISWDIRDSVEQRLKITEIRVPGTYVGFENRYADDIAVLATNESIKFSSIIMPICIDWSSELTIDQLYTNGTVVGWGLNEKGKLNVELSQAQLNYYNFSTCRNSEVDEGFSRFVTSDKYCAGLKNGTAVEKGDSGGGFVFPRNSTDNIHQYYLYGIVSTKDTWRSNIAAFTDVNKHLSWLNSTIASIIEAGFCPQLKSRSVELTLCNINSTDTDCRKPSKPTTKAKVRCRSSFHAGSPFKLYTDTTCFENRTWSPLNDSCVDCGKRYRFRDIELLSGRKPKDRSEFPWHVGLYSKKKTDIRYICGGTIIHPKVVLTAAHCVTDSVDFDVIYVAAGKYNANWTVRTPYDQIFQVSNIYTKDTYRGLLNYYIDDIAILELNTTISISDYIMPVCIDWSRKLQLHKNPLVSGLSLGWGWDYTGKLFGELSVAKLLFLEWDKCKEVARSYSKIPLTIDKLCATSDDGFADLKAGYSGGSLTFPKYDFETKEQTNYIYGLVSLKTEDNIYRFTNILYHANWVENILTSIITKDEKMTKR